MLRKQLLILFIVFSTQIALSQTYKFKKTFTPDEVKEFLGLTKKIFNIEKTVSYNFSTSDAKAKFKDINNIQYNNAYLEKVKAKLAKDSLDAMSLNDLANYYNKTGNSSLAKKHFAKSLANFSLTSLKKKDSAQYYSIKGILKFNLEKEDAITDLEKALKINPSDTIAMAFYPLMLLQKKDFTKAKTICINALEKKSDNPQLILTYYNMCLLYERLPDIMDPTKKVEFVKKNYDELYDLKSMSKYTELYKDNIEVQNLKKGTEVFAFYLKLLLFETSEDDAVIFNYNSTEIKRINELIVEFKELIFKEKINSFSGNKSLAMLYFLIDNKDKSIECAKKAVTALPEKQRTADFNSDESYDLLMTLYQLKKDAPNFKKTLEEKISKSSENQKTIKDCISMAYFYLYEKDYEQSEIWCKKAREIDSDDFKALCLLAHLKFLNSSNLSEFYLQQAFNQRKNDSDNSNLSIQAAMYMILVCNPDNAKAAFDNIEISQKINENNCPICDELLAKYIQVTP